MIQAKLKLSIHWGSIGFSLNVDVNGKHIALIIGYPRSSAYSQTIYTDVLSIARKVKGGQRFADSLRECGAQTKWFQASCSSWKELVTFLDF